MIRSRFDEMKHWFRAFLFVLPLATFLYGQDPTQIYKVGGGDLLRIEMPGVLKAPVSIAIRIDGTLDLPVAGGSLYVEGKTTREVESLLKSPLALLGGERVSVTVEKYVSHTINISGEVVVPGPKVLTREKVPFYVLRAISFPERGADAIEISKSDGTFLRCSFSECEKKGVVVGSGDAVKFISVALLAKKDE